MDNFDEKTLTNLVKRRHPDFDAKHEHWTFLNKTYESPREWFNENLFKFVREGDGTYTGRLERAYRFNHTREVVDLVNKYLFKNPPERKEDVSDEVIRFRSMSTLSGLTIEQFERQVARKASIYGRVYVVVDNNAMVDEIVTKADEKNGNVKLYAYIVSPDQMLDCGYDRSGDFSWVLVNEKARDDADPFDVSGGEIIDKYRLWTKNNWYLFTTKKKDDKTVIELEDEGVHGLGVVPVIKCDHIESDNKYSVPALIEDIAYLDRAVANYCSNLDQIINDQTFSQLIIPASALISGIGSTINTVDPNDPDVLKRTKEIIALGTSQVLLYDSENGSAPSYISPDPKQAQIIISTIKQIINEIYHTVGLAGERTKQDNSMGIDNSSGVAKAYDFEKVNALLSAKANAMQVFSNRIENLVKIYHGEKIQDIDQTEVNVEYSTNFDVRGLNDELAIANQFSILAVPMEMRRTHMKNIVEKMWPMMDDAEKDKIDSAIDKWEDVLYLQGSGANASGIDKADPLGKNTRQGLPGKTKGAAKE
jgi:hypothetical protein